MRRAAAPRTPNPWPYETWTEACAARDAARTARHSAELAAPAPEPHRVKSMTGPEIAAALANAPAGPDPVLGAFEPATSGRRHSAPRRRTNAEREADAVRQMIDDHDELAYAAGCGV